MSVSPSPRTISGAFPDSVCLQKRNSVSEAGRNVSGPSFSAGIPAGMELFCPVSSAYRLYGRFSDRLRQLTESTAVYARTNYENCAVFSNDPELLIVTAADSESSFAV